MLLLPVDLAPPQLDQVVGVIIDHGHLRVARPEAELQRELLDRLRQQEIAELPRRGLLLGVTQGAFKIA